MAQDTEEPEDRRALLEKAGKVVVTAPAAALLLSAANRQAFAAQYWNPGKGNQDHPGTGNGGPNGKGANKP